MFLVYILYIVFRSSHIFRKGNQVADVVADYGSSSTDFIWWDSALPFASSLCNGDILGLPYFRFL